jgi:phosphonatase-like hydrolase
MAIKLVVFDIAGTTVKDENNVHKSLQSALAKAGVKASIAEINPLMGYPKPLAVKMLLEQKLEDKSVITNASVEQIHSDYVQEMISFYQNSPAIVEKEGATKTFEALHRHKIKVALDTGFDRPTVNILMDRLGWVSNGLVDYTVTSDEVENGRPFPDMIYRAMELASVKEVQEVAKVGDTSSDMQEGMAAGCKYVVGVTTGAFAKEDLAKEKHTHLIEQLPELLDILDLTA